MSMWSSLVKIGYVSTVAINSKPTSCFFGVYSALIFIRKLLKLVKSSTLANIWEKAISIMPGNLNSSLSYLITTVLSVLSDNSLH